jgi:uncharacterized protein (DUF2141 family)
MKRLFLAAAGAFAIAAPAYAASLTVDLDGVRSAGGTLFVSVQTRQEFMQERGTAGSVVTSPQAGAHRFSFDVPAGEYAVSVWHDDNGNGRFDKNDRHIPLDGWAMTNSQALRGEPSFDQVRTRIDAGPAAVHLTMTYGR